MYVYLDPDYDVKVFKILVIPPDRIYDYSDYTNENAFLKAKKEHPEFDIDANRKCFREVKGSELLKFSPEFLIKFGYARVIGETEFVNELKSNLSDYIYDKVGGKIEPITEENEFDFYYEDKCDVLRIRVVFSINERKIYIPNIAVCGRFKYRSIGKELIKICYRYTRLAGWCLYIVQMTESFYNRLIKRGGIRINDDTVQIVNSTNLD